MLENILRSFLGLPRKASFEERIVVLETAVIRLCDVLATQIERIDENTKTLDHNIKSVAQAVTNTIRPFPGQSNN